MYFFTTNILFCSPSRKENIIFARKGTVMKSEGTAKQNREIVKKLFSASDGEVLSVIREIRSNGNPGLIPALIKLYDTTGSRAVSTAVVSLIRDLKSQPAVSQLFPAIHEIKDPEKRRELVAACWQSGLDFSEHLDTFLDIFSRGDYMTALEAFTVIENSLPYLHDASSLQEHISRLKDNLPENNDEKKALSRALLSLMEEHLLFLSSQP